MKKLKTNSEWISKAREVLPAGGFGNFDPSIIISHGKGSHIWDADGNKYIDYLIGSGPMLLGHCDPEVNEVVIEQLNKGMTFFANNTYGIELAEKICQAVPCCEQVRFVSSGGEADMYAMRLARAFTGKEKILKFEGGYHGMSAEAQMSLAPNKEVNFPIAVPDSGGIPKNISDNVLIAPFNDLEAVKSLMDEHDDIAAIIVEPLQRIIPPLPNFLEGLKKLCNKNKVLLIFDEIVTCFRLAYGGAQEKYNVVPDICTLGKVIGGGFAIAAVGANEDIMKHFDKNIVKADQWLMQVGTLSGNPIAAVAGLKTMEILKRPGSYEKLRKNGKYLMNIQSENLKNAGIYHQVVGDETLFDIIFTDKPCLDYRSTKHKNQKMASKYNEILFNNGILKAPSKLYPSLALDEKDLEQTKNAVELAVNEIKNLVN